jgi:hypothetical protein
MDMHQGEMKQAGAVMSVVLRLSRGGEHLRTTRDQEGCLGCLVGGPKVKRGETWSEWLASSTAMFELPPALGRGGRQAGRVARRKAPGTQASQGPVWRPGRRSDSHHISWSFPLEPHEGSSVRHLLACHLPSRARLNEPTGHLGEGGGLFSSWNEERLRRHARLRCTAGAEASSSRWLEWVNEGIGRASRSKTIRQTGNAAQRRRSNNLVQPVRTFGR